MSIERYKQIAKSISKFREVKIKTYIPTPTDVDYQRGYITRYFIQKINDKTAQIYEIKSDNFSKFGENPFWNAVSIRWKISGKDQTTYNQDGTVKEYSISESNSRSIGTVKDKMSSLKLYLPNLKQFAK